jgi:hypothetical protein
MRPTTGDIALVLLVAILALLWLAGLVRACWPGWRFRYLRWRHPERFSYTRVLDSAVFYEGQGLTISDLNGNVEHRRVMKVDGTTLTLYEEEDADGK